MVLINLLTSIWKIEVDDVRKHVVVATRRLPPRNVAALAGDAVAVGAPGRRDGGRVPHGVCGRHTGHHVGPSGGTYGGGLGGNGQHGGMDGQHKAIGQRSQVHLVAPAGAAGRGSAAHAARGFHYALAGFSVGGRGAAPSSGETSTGPNLRGRLDKGLAITRRVRCLPTFHMREAALGALANSVALYGVQLADVEGRILSLADTAAVKAMWGPTWCSRAKEVPWCMLARGFYVSPMWRVQYQRLLWLACKAPTPGATQTLVQAVLECRDPLPSMGPVGRTLQAASQMGWQRREGWWH